MAKRQKRLRAEHKAERKRKKGGSRKGRKLSEAHKKAISAGMKRYWKSGGHTHHTRKRRKGKGIKRHSYSRTRKMHYS
jgi:hypothetical protein